MEKIELFPVTEIGELEPGHDLAALVAERFSLADGDVVVFSSKAVSKTEGRIVAKEQIEPSPFACTLASRIGRSPWYCELILRESVDLVRCAPGVVICRTRHGFVLANAGVDSSNAGGADRFVLLPLDPDGSARKLREAILSYTGKWVGVILSDTFGRPWRLGQTDLAIGTAGLSPLRDYRGQTDHDGRSLAHTCMAQADELASAAELVRGKADGIPAVVIRGFVPQGDGAAASLVIPFEQDLFR